MGAMVIHDGRKLFADSFLSGMKPMCFIATGNCWQMVSYPAWRRWHFIAIGNFSLKVSYSNMTPLRSTTIGNLLPSIFYVSLQHHIRTLQSAFFSSLFKFRRGGEEDVAGAV